MIKFIIIFIAGVIETFIYTAWCISANKKELNKSSILMFVYMSIYLIIITFAMKDTNTIGLIITYAISCGVGNYAEILWENKNEKANKKLYKNY